MTLALKGIKVLDFSRFLPGPFATYMLGDFGAEIIHVEEPAQTGGRRAEQAAGTVTPASGSIPRPSNPYNQVGRNKKSIVLNLKNPKAQAIALELAKRSDILVEEFRPGVMKRFGLDYGRVSKLNPRLIYCSVTLYGQTGPYKDHPGHDPCALAVAGVLNMHSDPEGRLKLLALPFDDYATGLHGAIGILLALEARHLTGKGQHVDISMLDSALDFMGGVASSVFRGRRARRLDIPPNPSGNVFQCKDGKWVCTTNAEPHHWANFCRSIGHPEWIPYQFNSRERLAELTQAVAALFLTKTQKEWLDIFWGPVESQAAPANSPEKVWQDSQVLARNMVWELDHPEQGKVKQLGQSIKLSDTPAQFRSFAAPLGQHTEEVLASLGYDQKQIHSFKEAGAVV